MNTRSKIEAVVGELRRLKSEGVEHVFVGEDSLDSLRMVAGSHRRTSVETPQASTHADEAVDVPESGEPVGKVVIPDTVPSYSPVANLARSQKPAVEAQDEKKLPDPIPFELPKGDKRAQWEWLRNHVVNCPVCNANLNPGKQVVFGNGDIDAEIFFCGEAPGADEESEGIPFVGKAGQLLMKIIGAMGLSREKVYIGNIMNWRPQTGQASGNRPPTPEEMAFCLPYLRAQVAVVKPKVIVALGNTAVTGLLGPDPNRRMGAIRGRWFDFGGTPLIPTFHPSYVLRYGNDKTKRQIWEDMLEVMRKVGLPVSEKQEGYFLPKQ